MLERYHDARRRRLHARVRPRLPRSRTVASRKLCSAPSPHERVRNRLAVHRGLSRENQRVAAELVAALQRTRLGSPKRPRNAGRGSRSARVHADAESTNATVATAAVERARMLTGSDCITGGGGAGLTTGAQAAAGGCRDCATAGDRRRLHALVRTDVAREPRMSYHTAGNGTRGEPGPTAHPPGAMSGRPTGVRA